MSPADVKFDVPRARGGGPLPERPPHCSEGDWVSISTRRGSARAPVEISPAMQPGHVSLPNGLGLDYQRSDGVVERRGVALNELTNTFDRDPIAGTPWHKRVPARIERVADQADVSAQAPRLSPDPQDRA